MDFSGFSFDPASVVAFFAEAWLLGMIGGGVAAALFSVVSGRRSG